MAYTILIVDDEPDIHTATQLSLKRMQFQHQSLNLVSVNSGVAALHYMQEHPETAVILMDVVMEEEQAGLMAIREIRQELGNEMVRILLRTGQPGTAPEKTIIDEYDIDGYLAKSELTQTRLYSSVRSALKSFSELQELQRHRDALVYLNQSLMALYDAQSPDDCLQTLVEIAAALSEAPLTLLYLETQMVEGAIPQSHLYYHGPKERSSEDLEAETQNLLGLLSEHPEILSDVPSEFAKGYLVPLFLKHHQGQGFLYVENQVLENLPFLAQTLPILAGHAAMAFQIH